MAERRSFNSPAWLPGSGGEDRRRGAVLLVVLLGLVVVSLLVSASAGIAGDEHRSARAMREGTNSMYSAETGLHRTLAEWPDSAVAVLNSGDSLDLGWANLPDGGSYRAVIQRTSMPGDQPLQVIRVVGRSGGPVGGEAALELWVTANSVFPAFPGAINAAGDADLSGTGYTDSYDSSLGPYGGANIGSNGDVFANGDISPASGGMVNGDATAGGVVSDPTAVTGTSTSFSPPVDYPAAQCPSGGYTPASNMPSGPNVLYDEVTGLFHVQADSVPWTGGTYYIHELKANSGTSIYIPAAEVVTVYVDGDVTMNGGAAINNHNQDPSQLMIIGCGDGFKDAFGTRHKWTINGGSEAFMAVYAPQFDIKLTGGAPLYGGVVGYDVDVSTVVHFDENLSAMSLSLGVQAIQRPWIQLLRTSP